MLPSELVKQVRRIQLQTGRQVADVLAGAYLSVFKGRGMEFEEVRPYVPGDDIRTIDWNVTARVGEPYIKRYVEERQLTVMLLVDVSPSLSFGSHHRSKLEAATELSALLAFSAIENDDKVGVLLFRGQAETYIPPRKGQKHALRVIREVLAHADQDREHERTSSTVLELPRLLLRKFRRLRAKTSKTTERATNISHALEFCRQVLPRRTVLFLISDFLDGGYLNALRSANRRNDVVCVLVSDPREREFPNKGLVNLRDAETGASRLVDTSSREFRDRLTHLTRSRITTLGSTLRSSNMDLIEIDASRSVVDPLIEFFRMREQRLRR